jgi:hypothetical protein
VAVLVLVIVIGLATLRASRVLAVDQFPLSKLVRDSVAARFGSESWQAYLSECMWCAPVWVAGIFTFGYDAIDWLPGLERTSVPMPFFVFLAAALVASLVHVNLDGE